MAGLNKTLISDFADRLNEFAIRYSVTTGMADPGSGYFRMDNVDPASATTMVVSSTDLDGNDVSIFLTNLQQGETITFIGAPGSGTAPDPTKWHRITVNGSVTDNGTWFQFNISYVAHGGVGQTLNDRDRCFMKCMNNVSAAGLVEFDDSTFRVYENADPTSKLAFDVSAVSPGTTRTITMPDSDIDLGALGGGAADVQIFTTSGTWTKPATGTLTRIIMMGGGGGGGSGRVGGVATTATGGSGGSAAPLQHVDLLTSSLSATETITIGAGGTGGAAVTAASGTDGNDGTDGGRTSMDGVVGSLYGLKGLAGKNAGTVSGAVAVAADQMWGITGGSNGGASTVGAGSQGASIYANCSTGGAGGGGHNFAVQYAGGAARDLSASYAAQYSDVTVAGGTAGAVGGGNGGNGNAHPNMFLGTGGGGGGSDTTGFVGGAGGNGGGYGSGGGGGASSGGISGTGTSGAGGDGADGIMIVITY